MKELNQCILHLDIPERMQKLPIDERGFPVPWFVPWIDGKPEFRGMDGEKFGIAIRHKRCWLCGQPLGKYMVFVIGPMCAVNRVSSEPPSHRDCAHYAVRACPFLTQPRMRRNEKDLPKGTVAGIAIKRNPGCTLLWTTLSYRVFKTPPPGGLLLQVGEPESLEYFTEARKATREEILESMQSGLPLLMKAAITEGSDAIAALQAQYVKALELVPQ
jgi:hypothetical protein